MKTMLNIGAGLLLLLVLLGLTAAVMSRGGGSPAALPAVFEEGLTFEAALDRAGSDRPVVAVVSADWCGPCQHFKSEGLAGDAFARWVEERGAVPVMIDATDGVPGGVSSWASGPIPSTRVFVGGEGGEKLVGAVPEGELIAWLEKEVGGS